MADRSFHYAEAERLLRLADAEPPSSEITPTLLGLAQVHATLATAPDAAADEGGQFTRRLTGPQAFARAGTTPAEVTIGEAQHEDHDLSRFEP